MDQRFNLRFAEQRRKRDHKVGQAVFQDVIYVTSEPVVAA